MAVTVPLEMFEQSERCESIVALSMNPTEAGISQHEQCASQNKSNTNFIAKTNDNGSKRLYFPFLGSQVFQFSLRSLAVNI